MRPSRIVPVLVLVGMFLPALPGAAQEREKRLDTEDFHRILDGLERGVVALRELGMTEEAQALNGIADRVRRELKQDEGHGEREIAKHQIKALKMAKEAFQEAGKEEAAGKIHWAIRTLECGLEGRRDEEAREIRKRAPGREETIKYLVWAEKLYREWGNEERAAALSRMTEKLWSRPGDGERAQLRREIDIMKLAKPALREADRKDTLELLEHAMHARELALEGRKDEEAMHIRKTAPDLGAQIEILTYSADLWRKFGNDENANALGKLAHELRARNDRRHAKRDHPRVDREFMKHQIEVFGIARHAFDEAEKPDAADIMRRAAHVRKVNLAGYEGEDAEKVRRSAPSLEREIEFLGHASRLWKEWGHEEKARTVGQLARKLGAHHRERKTDRREPPREKHIDELRDRMGELEHAIRALKEELERLRHSEF